MVALVCGAVRCRQEKALDGDPTFSVTVLLGRREEPALMLCARGLVERLAEQGCQRWVATRTAQLLPACLPAFELTVTV